MSRPTHKEALKSVKKIFNYCDRTPCDECKIKEILNCFETEVCPYMWNMKKLDELLVEEK